MHGIDSLSLPTKYLPPKYSTNGRPQAKFVQEQVETIEEQVGMVQEQVAAVQEKIEKSAGLSCALFYDWTASAYRRVLAPASLALLGYCRACRARRCGDTAVCFAQFIPASSRPYLGSF